MWHVEGFDAVGDPGEMAEWLSTRFLPYFRERGFSVRVFGTQVALGPRQFWLVTEIDGFADVEGWAERAGEDGATLVRELLARTTRMTAGIVGEIGAERDGPDPEPDAPETVINDGPQMRRRVGHRVRQRPKLT